MTRVPTLPRGTGGPPRRPDRTSDVTRLRLSVVGVVVLCLFFAMFARLWYLQVLDAPAFSQLAVQNQVRQVRDPAPRGLILARYGRPMVANQTVEVVTLSKQVADASKTAGVVGRLAAVLGMTPAQVQARLNDTQFSVYRPVPIKSDVSKATVIYLREHQDQFPGVTTQLLAERSYPYGATAAQLLGYVGEISAQGLKALANQGYQPGDSIGDDGVEATYEPWLRGQAGVTKLAVDAQGKVVSTLGVTPPAPGEDVQLNIDLGLQQTVDQALAQGITSIHGTIDASTGNVIPAASGAAVVLDPRNGAVLAMSSYPSYDPGVWVGGISTQQYQGLSDPNSHYPLLNRAIAGLYTPGSTFKLATGTAALNTGLITPSTLIDDPGSFTIPGQCSGKCTFHDAESTGQGYIDISRAITVSSDVFFYTLGYDFFNAYSRYGPTPVQQTANAYGLGVPSGVDLPGGNVTAARIDSLAEEKKLCGASPKAYDCPPYWNVTANMEMAFGQGATVITPLQLAEAYATFANGGTRYQPRVVADVLAPDAKLVKAFPPKVTGHVPMSAANHQALLAGFVGAVQDPQGTAYGTFQGFDFSKLSVAGKTGTASTGHPEPNALFVAFAPTDHPRYVVAVIVDEAGYGSVGAAPIAKQILQYLADHPVAPVSPKPVASP